MTRSDFPFQVRPENPDDIQPIRQVLEMAFERPEEADLVEALRRRGMVTLSLVALQEGRVIGNIIFSPVSIESPAGKFPALGLGPLAVIPSCQKRGVGGALIQAGVETCRIAGHPAVVLVGHPGYYRRFGFVAAAALGLTSEFEVAEEYFLVLELEPGALRGKGGTVFYQPEFHLV